MKQQNLGGFLVIRPRPLKKQKGPYSFLLQSDIHVGSSHSDLEHVREELQWARRNNARVLVNGDMLDGVYSGDKRFRPSCLKPDLAHRDDVLDAELDMAFQLYRPYADLLDMCGLGNHEDHLVRLGHTDPILRLVQRLNDDLKCQGSKHQISYGGYAGMILYQMPQGNRLNLAYHHGWGKGAALSSSLAQFKSLDYLEDIDVYWLGHLHSRLNSQVFRVKPPAEGWEPVVREVRYVRTGAYIHSAQGQSPEHITGNGRKTNYAMDAGFPLHGRGGARILVHCDRRSSWLEVCQ